MRLKPKRQYIHMLEKVQNVREVTPWTVGGCTWLIISLGYVGSTVLIPLESRGLQESLVLMLGYWILSGVAPAGSFGSSPSAKYPLPIDPGNKPPPTLLFSIMVDQESDPLLQSSSSKNGAASEFPSFWQLLRHGVVLDNVGSTARDHLANERTYLAWIRTALALTGVGIGLLKWEGVANSSGYLVLVGGFFVLMNSSFRYILVMSNLSRAKFEPNVRSLLAMVVVISVLIVSLVILAASGNI